MNTAPLTREFKELPIALIDAPVLPSRSAMDDTLLDELVASIRENGLLQPIGVERAADRFTVIYGHRRRVASERAGLVGMPAFIYASRAEGLDALQFAENRHREQLSAADEAIWFAELLENKCGGDIEKLAGLVGEKIPYIDNRLALFRGFPVVFEALQAGKIKIGVAHALNKFPEEKWARYYLDCALRCGATVAIVDGWLIDHKRAFSAPQLPDQPAPSSPGGMPTEEHHPFVCVMCGKHDNLHLMKQLSVHQHCQLAILDPLLAAYRGES